MSGGALRLRPSVHYAPVRDGVYFAGRGDGFVLHGPPALARVADVVVARLDEGATEAAVLAALPDGPARGVAARILAELRERDLLLDLAALTVPALPAELLAAYGDTVAHLEAVSDDPYAAFLRVRAAEVAVRGSGEAAERARAALAALGAGVAADVTAATTLVVEVTEDAEPGALAAAADRALAAGLPLVHCLVTDGGVVVAGPRTRAAQPRLADAVRRAAARRESGLAAPRLEGRPNPVLGAFGGNLAAHRAFQWAAGLAGPGERLLLVDAETLDVTEHAVPGLGESGGEGGPDELLAAAEALCDAAFGVFGEPSPYGLPQSPVFATSVRLLGGAEVRGFGLSEAESRYRALVEAVRAAAGSGPAPVAVGHTAAAMTVDGVARALLRDWLRAGGGAAERLAFADVTDELARLCWKTLAVRHGRDVAVVCHRPAAAPIWLVAVHEDGRLGCAGYGTTPDRALRDTLVTALGAVQAGDGAAAARVAGWVDGPAPAGTADVLPAAAEVLASLAPPYPVTPVAEPVAAAAGVVVGRGPA